MTWMSDVLLDMAAFAEENELPETYDALIKAMAITTVETQQNGRFTQRSTSNVISLFENGNGFIALPQPPDLKGQFLTCK